MEEVLCRHPLVAEAACIGIPEKHFGEAVKAFVVLKKSAEATPEELIDFCRGKLDKYKIPRQLEIRDKLPKNAAGKIMRLTLSQEEQKRRRTQLLKEKQ